MKFFGKNIVVILLPLFVLTIMLFQNCAPMKTLEKVASSSNSDIDDVDKDTRKLVVAFGDSLTRGSNPKNPLNTGAKGYVPYLQAQFPNIDFLNCGIGGQTTNDAKARYLEILNGDYTNCSQDIVDSDSTANFYDFSTFQGKKPDHILLWLGTNDVLKNNPTQRTSLNLLKWYLSQAVNRNIKINMSNLIPYGNTSWPAMISVKNGESFDRIQTYNSLIDQAASQYNVSVIDMYTALKSYIPQYTWDQIHLKKEAYAVVAALWAEALKNNTGKALFTSQGTPCMTASNVWIPNQVVVCSCASGSQGLLYRCQNGTFQELFPTQQSCSSITENHEYIVHHCS